MISKFFSILFVSAFLLVGVMSVAVPLSFAQTNTTGVTNTQPQSQTVSGTIKLDNPLGSIDTPQKLIGKVIAAILGLVGSLALVMFVYGGLLWMTSAGNDQQVTKGKNILLWSAIGLIIIFTSYALVKFVVSELAGA